MKDFEAVEGVWRGFTVKSVSNIQSFGKSRRTMMREANERVVDDLNASSAKDLGIYKKKKKKKNCRTKMEQANVVEEVEEILL